MRAVFDSVGKDTFDASLDCLAPRGMLVLFGQSSGVVPPFDPSRWRQRVAVPDAPVALALRRDARGAGRVGGARCSRSSASGAVKIEIGQTYPLRDAAAAHRDLEARRTTGSTLLSCLEPPARFR